MIGLFYNGTFNPGERYTIQAIVGCLHDIFEDNICFISTYKTSIPRKINVPINEVFIDADLKTFDGWSKRVEHVEKVFEENNIDSLIIFKTTMLSTIRKDNYSQIKSFYKKRKVEDKCYNKFVSVYNIYSKLMIIEAAFKNDLNMYQIVIDPFEVCYGDIYNKECKYLYNQQKVDNLGHKYIYMPLLEVGLNNITSLYVDREKEYDFAFHCTCLTDDRNFVIDNLDILNSISNSDIHINTGVRKIKDTYKNVSKQDEYYYILAKSKYTLCISSYDVTTFSMYRFIEAIQLDCLCLVHTSCCLDDVRNTFPDICRIIEKHLVVDFCDVQDKINDLTDRERYDIIEEIKQTKSWRKFMDFGYVKNRWERLLCV